jgi:predicted nucleic acid-binding protein
VKRVIVDTGPLVAYFDRDSEFHPWARDRFRELADPLISCQPVLTEALFVLKRGGIDPDRAPSTLRRLKRGWYTLFESGREPLFAESASVMEC